MTDEHFNILNSKLDNVIDDIKRIDRKLEKLETTDMELVSKITKVQTQIENTQAELTEHKRDDKEYCQALDKKIDDRTKSSVNWVQWVIVAIIMIVAIAVTVIIK